MSSFSPSFTASEHAHHHAAKLMPGGVNSPVRAYKAVGRTPITIASGQGCHLTDLDGNRYIDFVGSYGPLILGHRPAVVADALTAAIAHGWTFGMPTLAESHLAQQVIDAVPSIERVRFVNSGTEATMSALRLARAATGRDKILKCTGCYHGHADALLAEAGSGATTLGTPSSPGVPAAVTRDTLLIPFNDLAAAQAALAAHQDQVAAIILEPVAGNMGCIPPDPGYLEQLRELCTAHGTLLIFDEVMTGFRVAWGGAQARYGIQPDLTCLGKIVGGGLPCAAYGGRKDLMDHVAPAGPVYQAGTLSGNPLAMAAGLATLRVLAAEDQAAYTQLEARGRQLASGLQQRAKSVGVPAAVHQVGSMITLFFLPEADAPVRDYQTATACRTDRFAAFFGAMLNHGVLLPPSQFETWFISTAHDESVINATLTAAEKALAAAAALP